MNLSKNNRFSTQKAVNCILCTEKRKKAPVCEIPESFGSFSFSILPILSWKLKTTEFRGRSMIPTSSKSELFCRYAMTS